MSEFQSVLPKALGVTTVHTLVSGRQMRFFLIDAALPLYSVVVDDIKFFVNVGQIAQVIEQLNGNPDEPVQVPSWQWKFDGGFQNSIDGRGARD